MKELAFKRRRKFVGVRVIKADAPGANCMSLRLASRISCETRIMARPTPPLRRFISFLSFLFFYYFGRVRVETDRRTQFLSVSVRFQLRVLCEAGKKKTDKKDEGSRRRCWRSSSTDAQ